MLSTDLAGLYQVEARILTQAVKRNKERFPADFMFRLTLTELRTLPSGAARGWGTYAKHPPYAFTEQGVAMLSSVLRSRRAIVMNVEIMRTFVRLRGALALNRAILKRLLALESRTSGNEDQLEILAEAIRRLESVPEKETPEIGFRP